MGKGKVKNTTQPGKKVNNIIAVEDIVSHLF